MAPGSAPSISDYALVGDTRTAALVSREGSVDWLCLPRFDSPAVLCRILDAERGGSFRIAPTEPFTVRRRYREGTAILETTFTSLRGICRVTDLMPVASLEADGGGPGAAPRLLRVVEGLAGDVPVGLRFHPTPNFASRPAWLRLCDRGVVATAGAEDATVALASAVPLHVEDGTAIAAFRVRAGERRAFALSPGDVPRLPDTGAQIARTDSAWRGWLSRCAYDGPHRERVLRSTITLKLLTYSPTGALVAAPTTSLPEEIGGVRNWDYRFTWLRDAGLVLDALVSLGFHGEATAFWRFIERLGLQRGAPLQIMYGIDGRTEIEERTLDHLAGHRGSRPVRVGNAAARQLQLDVPGYVLDAAYVCQERMREPHADLGPALRTLADYAAERWQQPDLGIWEVRTAPRHFVHSKVMSWVALDRAARLSARGWLQGDARSWRTAADAIRADVLASGWDPRRRSFTRSYGESALDATSLLMAGLGFLDAADERWVSTVRAVRERLTSGGLVYRYLGEDGVPGNEATFTMCTYWLAEALAATGDVDGAHEAFERASEFANDVDLLAEELDPATGEQLGNFPQAFSHLALVRAALVLSRGCGPGPGTAIAEPWESQRGRRGHRPICRGARPDGRRSMGPATGEVRFCGSQLPVTTAPP